MNGIFWGSFCHDRHKPDYVRKLLVYCARISAVSGKEVLVISVVEQRFDSVEKPSGTSRARKLITGISICLTLILLLAALPACSDGEKISGVYQLTEGNSMGLTYDFSLNGRVEISGYNEGKKFRRSGFYKIYDNLIEITMSDGSRAICEFEQRSNSIVLDGIEYKKVK